LTFKNIFWFYFFFNFRKLSLSRFSNSSNSLKQFSEAGLLLRSRIIQRTRNSIIPFWFYKTFGVLSLWIFSSKVFNMKECQKSFFSKPERKPKISRIPEISVPRPHSKSHRGDSMAQRGQCDIAKNFREEFSIEKISCFSFDFLQRLGLDSSNSFTT